MNKYNLEPHFFDNDYTLMFSADVSTEERMDMLELHKLRTRILEITTKYKMFES